MNYMFNITFLGQNFYLVCFGDTCSNCDQRVYLGLCGQCISSGDAGSIQV